VPAGTQLILPSGYRELRNATAIIKGIQPCFERILQANGRYFFD
jgi:hypothetical protein